MRTFQINVRSRTNAGVLRVEAAARKSNYSVHKYDRSVFYSLHERRVAILDNSGSLDRNPVRI